MEMNYCRRCGSVLQAVEHHTYQCAAGHTIFANASAATGVFIIDENNNVTLSVRGIEPHKGMLDAFGGFLDGAERVEDGLERELREELDLEPRDYTAPVFLCSGVGKYPYQGDITPVVSLLFFIQLTPHATITPQDDVAETVTYPLHEIPLDQLHDEDIITGIKALQTRLG